MGTATNVDRLDLPGVFTCPKCQQNSLQIFDDIVSNNLWLNCRACAARGDIITFSTDLWKTSLTDSLDRFIGLGLTNSPESDEQLVKQARITDRRLAAERFWAGAAANLWDHNDDVVACRLRDLGVRHEVPQCQNIVGVAQNEQIIRLCADVNRHRPALVRNKAPAIVFPFFDLPGRLIGFLLIQYGELNTAKETFISISGRRKHRPDAGYFLLDALNQGRHDIYINTQFVVDDIFWALRAQTDAVTRGLPLLPVAACYTGPEASSTGQTLTAMAKATRIFTGFTGISPNLISQAGTSRGYVARAPMPVKRETTHYLADVRSAATTWRSALDGVLRSMPEKAVEDFALQLTIPDDKLTTALTPYLPKVTRDRVVATTAIAQANPAAQLRWLRSVIERPSGWWSYRGQHVCNVLPRIEEILQFTGGESIYRGTVTTDTGAVFPFEESAKKIETTGLLAFARGLLAVHGKLVVFERAWNMPAAGIALRINPPKLTTIPTHYGWDEQTGTFRFTRYELTRGGDIRPLAHVRGCGPETHFEEPTTTARLSLRSLLTPAHENSFIWVVAGCVIRNLLAPIFHKDFVATAICSKNADVAARIAEALGCRIEQTTAVSKKGAADWLGTIAEKADWPIFARGVFNDELFGTVAPRHFNASLLLCTAKPVAAVLPTYGWQRVREVEAVNDSNIAALRDILPAYIQAVLRDKPADLHRGQFTDQVIRHLRQWLLVTYGATFNDAHAATLLGTPETAHETLAEELADAVAAGKIAALLLPRHVNQCCQYFLRKHDRWWLNRRAIDRYFKLYKTTGPNWFHTLDLLRRDGVYISEQIIQNMPGVFVTADWFENFYEARAQLSDKEIG